MEPFDRYVAAWNAGDLERWLEAHDDEVVYVSLAGPEPRSFEGREGLRKIWAESRANWHRFELSVVDDDGDVTEVTFSGMVEAKDGRITRLWSALDASELP